MMRWWLPWLVIVAGDVTDVAAQPAMSPQARVQFDEGSRLYEEGRFTEAAAAFEAGFAIDPRPDFQYSLGQVYRRMGDCTKALAAYRAFLDSNPPVEAAARARANQDRCRQTMGVPDGLEPKATPTTPKTQAPRMTSPPPVRVERRAVYVPWYRDWVGDILAGTGSVALVTSAAYVGLGARARSAARDSETLDEFVEHRDAAARDRTVAIVAGAIGGSLVVAGVVRYLLRSSTHVETIVISGAPGGGVLVGTAF